MEEGLGALGFDPRSVSLYRESVEAVVTGVEVVGAGILVIGGAVVLARQGRSLPWRDAPAAGYERLRRDLARVLLIGLEVLIVADIINTIIVETTLSSVGALGAIVLIRTVLSFSLDIEIAGTLPWRRPSGPGEET